MPKLSSPVRDRVRDVVLAAGYETLNEYLQTEYIQRKRNGAEMCRIMNIANRTFYVILDREGFPRPCEISARANYEDLDKDAIIEMLKAGKFAREIAEEHNCSKFLIYRIKREYKQAPSEVVEPPKKTPEEILQEQYPVAWKFAHTGEI